MFWSLFGCLFQAPILVQSSCCQAFLMRPAGKQMPQIASNAPLLKNATSIAFVERVRVADFAWQFNMPRDALGTQVAPKVKASARGTVARVFRTEALKECAIDLNRYAHTSTQVRFDKELPFKTTELRSMILLSARCR